jgi:cell shape-determining protein MreC
VRLTSSVKQEIHRPILGEGDLQRLSDELRYKDALIIAAQKRIKELEVVNSELQGLQQRLGDAYLFRRVNVIGHSADPAAGTFQIGQGATSGLQVGMPAVEGANLIGRIVQVTPTTATIGPITAPGTLLEVLIAPAMLPRTGLPAERDQRVQVAADHQYQFVADDVDHAVPVHVGDYARLDDATGPSAWPRSVQGYIVGVVASVGPNPDDALRQRLVIRPLLSPRHVSAVTIIMPRDAATELPEEATAR